MKHKNILILLSFAIIASALLAFADVAAICGGAESGCVTVKNSTYASIAGVSTALMGLVALSILFIITLLNQKRKTKVTNNLLKVGLVVGSIGAIFFIYLQFFNIGAICKYCMVTDVSLILAAIIFFLPEEK